jgi:hypothetical protein
MLHSCCSAMSRTASHQYFGGLLRQPAHGIPQHIGVLVRQHLPTSSPTLILPASVIEVLLSLEPKHRRF